jgi:HAD superfamily hydrolase (TIGR01509 family)
MSSVEWSCYMHETVGFEESPQEISDAVVRKMETLYREELPLIPGASEAVRRLAGRWRLGLASSSNRELIDLVLDLSGLAPSFAVTVSSEEVARGKPAPDVYLEAARRLGVGPRLCAAVEDSQSGIESASRAGMRVIALPNPQFPPGDDALALARVVIRSPDELSIRLVETL